MEDIFLAILIGIVENDIHWYLFGIVLLLMPVWGYCWYKVGKDLKGFIRGNHNGERNSI